MMLLGILLRNLSRFRKYLEALGPTALKMAISVRVTRSRSSSFSWNQSCSPQLSINFQSIFWRPKGETFWGKGSRCFDSFKDLCLQSPIEKRSHKLSSVADAVKVCKTGTISCRCCYWSRISAAFFATQNKVFFWSRSINLSFIRDRCCHLLLCLHRILIVRPYTKGILENDQIWRVWENLLNVWQEPTFVDEYLIARW